MALDNAGTKTRAAKSNAGYKAYKRALAFVKQDKSREVPIHLRNAPTKLGWSG
eukprot:gene14750-18847_t